METANQTLAGLLEHTRAELDEIAAEANIENPAGLANKQAVAEAILGISPPAETFTVKLADGFNAGQFHVDGAEVELDDTTATWSTESRTLYNELLTLPFLEAAP